ncbi:hypothetical protein PV328_010797 [Microctonus aethiopoides]|uniref:Uncharacterized protein n=1 Tax=Microctonus aethiopoides TaxID=144406 RepID=A0AA39FIY7_9HYME|nr:hypothetical protein PV328_010797 [Microctonus aethiopoides]
MRDKYEVVGLSTYITNGQRPQRRIILACDTTKQMKSAFQLLSNVGVFLITPITADIISSKLVEMYVTDFETRKALVKRRDVHGLNISA